MKSSEKIREEVREIFKQTVGIDPMDLNLMRKEIVEWDSLRQAQLILKLQDKFQIRFSAQEMIQCESYLQILNLVEQKTKDGK